MINFIIEHGHKLLGWSVFLGLMVGLAYTALVIKREKQDFLRRARRFSVHDFQLSVPPWWTLTAPLAPHRLEFERTDTHYDWKAVFEWRPLQEHELNTAISDDFVAYIQAMHILFDEEASIIHPQTHPLQKQVPGLEAVRIEGTATQNNEKRLYFDALLLKDHDRKGHLLCYSRSSVLNGAIEGPYFEEVIQRLEISRESNTLSAGPLRREMSDLVNQEG